MTLRNTAATWGGMSKTFHWLIVLLLIGQGILGLTMGDFPRETRGELIGLHKSIGITILLLAVARLLWNLFGGRPAAAPGVTQLQHRLAKLGHLVLYALLFAVPITGWLLTAYGGRDASWFGLFDLPRIVGENNDLHEMFEERHEQLFWVLVLVAAGHAGAAIYHHVFQRDATLARMLPRGWLRDPRGDA